MAEQILEGRSYRNKFMIRQWLRDRDMACSRQYLAENKIVNREEILKHGSSQSGSKDLVKRVFSREVELLQLLRGPNVPALFEANLETPEYTCSANHKSHTLQDFLQLFEANRPTTDQLHTLARSLVDLVSHCHALGVALGDTHPGWLVPIRGDSLVVVATDFSAAFREGEQPLYRNSDSPWAAPEFCNGEAVTSACDIYSMGMIFLSLFGGVSFREQRPIESKDLKRCKQPALRELIGQMLTTSPTGRPPLNEVASELKQAELAWREAQASTGAVCPKCRHRIRNKGASVCDQCGAVLARITRILMNDSSTGDNPVERIYKADQEGCLIDIVFWAKAGYREHQLTGASRLRALEAAVQIPREIAFAERLIADFPVEELQYENYLRYLSVLGQLLWIRTGGVSPPSLKARFREFAPFRAQFDQAVNQCPENVDLWRWSILATPASQRKAVIDRALALHADNPWPHYHDGYHWNKTKNPVAALNSWMRAVDLGLDSLPFKLQLYGFAKKLKQAGGKDTPESAMHTLRNLLMSEEPRTSKDYMQLILIARELGDRFREREFLDRALKDFPDNLELQQEDAQTLYNMGKHEWVIENYGENPRSIFLLRRVALAEYSLKQYQQAARRFAALLAQGGIAADYYYLGQCHSFSGDWSAARATVEQGLVHFSGYSKLEELRRTLDDIERSRHNAN